MARARSIGNVYAELSLKDTKFQAGVKRAQKSFGDFRKSFNAMASTALMAAPIAGIAALTASMKTAIDAGGKLSDMMAQTGSSGEGLYIMQRAFENAGIAGDKLPATINKMQKALAGLNDQGQRVTTRVFDDLGLSIGKLQAMDSTAAFKEISQAIASIDDPAKRAALAMEIFGRSGGELLVLMTDTAAFDVAEKQVGSLGKTLAENAAAFDRISDGFSVLKYRFTEVGAEVAEKLMPELNRLIDWAENLNTEDAGERIGAITSNVVKLTEKLAGLAKYNLIFQAGKGVESLLNNGGNMTEAERREAMAKGQAEANALYDAERGRVDNPANALASPEYQAEVDAFYRSLSEGIVKTVDEWIQPDVGVPPMLALPEIASTTNLPDWLKRGDSPDAPERDAWESSRAEVNAMQSRGLGMGGMQVPAIVNKQTSLLEKIANSLRKIEDKEGGLVYP